VTLWEAASPASATFSVSAQAAATSRASVSTDASSSATTSVGGVLSEEGERDRRLPREVVGGGLPR
jgi:hypothetical protein